MIESMLTTTDNPHDPFDDFDNWYAWDERSGYHSLSMLARITNNSDDISETDQIVAINDAIDEIVKENVCGMWRKVTREVPDF